MKEKFKNLAKAFFAFVWQMIVSITLFIVKQLKIWILRDIPKLFIITIETLTILGKGLWKNWLPVLRTSVIVLIALYILGVFNFNIINEIIDETRIKHISQKAELLQKQSQDCGHDYRDIEKEVIAFLLFEEEYKKGSFMEQGVFKTGGIGNCYAVVKNDSGRYVPNPKTPEIAKKTKIGSVNSFNNAVILASEYAEACTWPNINGLDVDLEKHEAVALCGFLYNLGEGKNSSDLFLSVKREESISKITKTFSGYRASRGVRANGLLKRHGIEALYYQGLISMEDILNYTPGAFYRLSENDFWHNIDNSSDLFKLKDDAKSVAKIKAKLAAVEGETIMEILTKSTYYQCL